MTRALIADPEMPRKAAAGRVEEIRICTGASEACIGRRIQGKTIACIQNPAIGREAELVERPPRSGGPGGSSVAGGGVAGLEAARMAAQRGHRVVLLEATAELGWPAPRPLPGAGAPELPARSSAGSPARSRARASTCASRPRRRSDSVLAERPDAVVVATGRAAAPSRGARSADGAHVVTAEDVLLGRAKPGRRVLIVRLRRPHARPRARRSMLADRGHEVEIATRFFSVGEDVDPRLKTSVYTRFYRKGVADDPALASSRRSVPGWVRLANTLTGAGADRRGRHGRRPRSAAARRTRSRAALSGRGLDIHVVGDALAPRTIHDAILTATRAARATLDVRPARASRTPAPRARTGVTPGRRLASLAARRS